MLSMGCGASSALKSKKGNAMLVRGVAGSIAVILFAGSVAPAADASPGDASSPSTRPAPQLPAARAVGFGRFC